MAGGQGVTATVGKQMTHNPETKPKARTEKPILNSGTCHIQTR